MAGSVLKARYRFVAGANAYNNDRLVPVTGISLVKNFVVPPDMTQQQATDIVLAAGGELISFGNIDVVPGTRNIPCSDSANFKPRKLKVIRANGNSFSIVLADRAGVIAASETIRATVDAISATNPVVCTQLIGEEYSNIYDELIPAGSPAPAPGAPSRPGAAVGKGAKYSGLMLAYSSDVPFQAITLAKFAVATETIGAPPALLGQALIDCLGTVQLGSLCPPSTSRTPRHFIVTSLVTGDEPDTTVTQVNKVPTASEAAADIITCGTALATLESTACLGYKGESYSRVHLLTVAPPA